MDDAVQIIYTLGKGTQPAKWDIKNAYRMVPVHPANRELLGMSWNCQTFVDTVLPFEFRSAPKDIYSSCRCPAAHPARAGNPTYLALFG